MTRRFYEVPLRLRSLFKRGRVEEELGDELRFHFNKLVEEKIVNGTDAEEARYAALRELGGLDQPKRSAETCAG